MKDKENKKDILVKILLGIVLILVLVILVLVFLKGKKVDTNSSLINEIYAKLGQNDLSFCAGLNTYGDDVKNYDSIDSSVRICNSIANLYNGEGYTLLRVDKTKKNNTCSMGEDVIFATDNYEDELCSIYRIDKSKVQEMHKSIYGKEIDSFDPVNLSNTISCFPLDDYYYCGLSETFTVTVGNEPETFRSIKEARESGDKIIVYDYFIKVLNDECYTSYMDNTTNASCTSEYKTNKNVDYDYLRKFGTLYKHTFKKNADGTYYWVQSEPK